ncbi:MAG: hypothetical protein K2Y39_16845 [Candidatus Obscuribacterales bacterium]|nr:hypothetical protein [Candidatus Obscuribacterales bacterium]
MKRELATGEIDIGKHQFELLVKQCSQELGLKQPVINWACEYERSVTRYIAFLFFGTISQRFHLNADELVALPASTTLKESLVQQINETLRKVPTQ